MKDTSSSVSTPDYGTKAHEPIARRTQDGDGEANDVISFSGCRTSDHDAGECDPNECSAADNDCCVDRKSAVVEITQAELAQLVEDAKIGEDQEYDTSTDEESETKKEK